tara:strand:- start:523 stop:819 length:297 start_codon:yes stop_codon:yes gene_type:complete
MERMNIESLKNDWKDNPQEFEKLVKNKEKYLDIQNKIFSDRTELFQKMDIQDLDEQRHLVDLINNVVWERQVSLKSTKTDLELCFTPDIREKLDGEDK